MPKSSKLPVIIGCSSIFCLGVGIYATPYLTLNSLKGAIEKGDSNEIANHIDFPALKSSAKVEFQTLINRQASSSNNPLAGLTTMVANPMVNSMVDKLVTPESFASLLKSSGDSSNVKVEMGYESFGTFIVKPDRSSVNLPLGAPAPSLILSRSGLGWKVTGIRIQ